MIWRTLLSIVIGIFAVYIGQEIFRSSYFFLKASFYVSPFYFIFFLSGIAYLYLITGLAILKRWAVYTFSGTILLTLLLSSYIFLSGGTDIKIQETIIRAMPGAWLIICAIILIRFIGLFILRKAKIVK